MGPVTKTREIRGLCDALNLYFAKTANQFSCTSSTRSCGHLYDVIINIGERYIHFFSDLQDRVFSVQMLIDNMQPLHKIFRLVNIIGMRSKRVIQTALVNKPVN